MTLVQKFQRARSLSRILSRGESLRLVFSNPSATAAPFAAPSLSGPLYLRPGTVDIAVLEKIFLHREYEPPFHVSARRIVDAGAHIGMASRFFAHRFPTARIVAVEPMEANLAVLRRNAAQCPEIRVLPGALWNRATALSGTDGVSWSHQMREASETKDAIRGITVPEIMAQEKWDNIDILKLDVEGAEREIFSEGADAWLPLVRLIVIELHDRFHAGCSAAFYQKVAPRLEAQEARGENIFVLLRSP
jgi:FkbM family methyltransferase